ncbi:benzoate 4-monooxygenase cytochrome P450 [Aspergillus arachidicola]|uniref:Benzoate 4-monooxygenase cytochrome P450 n=1 Tax=Aspergillus arachidicola TaxID=656916 RepID=A0A2G7G866_9EURO|nr:benzoate 4-monooxygenase cytochrome P450 [Aspergillus arachidicola]
MYSLLLIVTLHFLIYYIVIPIINYFRDPKGLRKYPNLTFVSGISDLPLIYYSHKGIHPVAIKDIYGHGTKCTKDVFYSALSGSHYHLADVVDKEDHARKRKVLSSAYAIKNLEAFDERCTSPLPKGQNPDPQDLTIDYRMWTNLYTIAAIANIGLSEDIRFLDQGNDIISSEAKDETVKKVHFRDCLYANASATSTLVWAYDWYEALVRVSKLVSSTYRQKWKLAEDWDGIVNNRATTRWKRYEKGEKLDDFFSALMEDKAGAPNNLEWGEIVAEVSIMMNAGSDTTGISLNNIDSVLEDDEVIAPYDKVKHLPYLRACLDENMRLYPPVSFHVPRRTPQEGTTIRGEFVAGDTSVGISAYVVHRNEDIFPDPDTYKPERWLGDKGRDLQPYFVAFSAGARGCIGRNISYLEQTVLLASLVHRFEFALPSPSWEPVRHETTNSNSGPMPLKAWRRANRVCEDN